MMDLKARLKVLNEKLETYLSDNYNLESEQGQVKILENQWDGDNPKDNIIPPMNPGKPDSLKAFRVSFL